MSAVKDEPMEQENAWPLQLEFQKELPKIVLSFEDDLEGALAAMDRYLDQQPPDSVRKSLLGWKGLFYLEHGRYEDAIRVFRLADEMNVLDDAQNFLTKDGLAKALIGVPDLNGAYDVLTQAVAEVAFPWGLLRLHVELSNVAASTGRPMPSETRTRLSQIAQYYGVDPLPEGEDAAALVHWLSDIVDACEARDKELSTAFRRAESQAEKERLVAEFLEEVDVPHFRERAKARLTRRP